MNSLLSPLNRTVPAVRVVGMKRKHLPHIVMRTVRKNKIKMKELANSHQRNQQHHKVPCPQAHLQGHHQVCHLVCLQVSKIGFIQFSFQWIGTATAPLYSSHIDFEIIQVQFYCTFNPAIVDNYIQQSDLCLPQSGCYQEVVTLSPCLEIRIPSEINT